MRYIWKKNDVFGVIYKVRFKNRILFLLELKMFLLDYIDYEVIILKKLFNVDYL